MGIIDTVIGIIKVKIKPRQDSYSDQFSRIFLLKMMFVGALFTGLSWYSGKITCLQKEIDGGFVSSACWINGLYVYDEIRFHDNDVGYYGIPRVISQDGINTFGDLCNTGKGGPPTSRKDATCKPMKKTFFLQYQYMTFFLIALGALYYVPYVVFKYVNTDIASLKTSIKGEKGEQIANNFFNRGINSTTKMKWRIFGTVVVKVLYMLSNVVAFVLADLVLHGRFRSYGVEWGKWSALNNSLAHDYMGKRHSPKPGNVLLPSFALCDVYETAQDLKHVVINKHRMICEMNEFILYQYVFIIIWWFMIAGLVVSVIGFFLLFVNYAMAYSTIHKQDTRNSAMDLTLRECEYLEYIRRKNLPVFGQVMEGLKNDRLKRMGGRDEAPPYSKVQYQPIENTTF